HCFEVMLQSNVLPIVNENDPVNITELMFTDNDELSGLIAEMIGAESLVILTDIDGVYDGLPEDEGSKVIRSINPEDSVEEYISVVKSGSGPRSLASKCHTARLSASKGIRVLLANGRRDNILVDMFENPQNIVFTEFTPAGK
ncbi:MAG: glutamate 5-kinase, partial [Bacteroidia bacterium]|nr:glutamate 5-kinase [Bacteroidia bacterium]